MIGASRSDGSSIYSAVDSVTDWSRLAKLAGMLGSPHDGERLNAARLLQAALEREGVTFGDLSQRIAEGTGSGYAPPRIVYVDREVVRRVYERTSPNPAADVARKILSVTDNGRRLQSSERRFLRSILANDDYTGGHFILSTAQANWLSGLQETHLRPKPKRYSTPKPKAPVDDSLLEAMGLTEKEKDIDDEAVGAFRARASGERTREQTREKPRPQGAGNAPRAKYRGDFDADAVDDFDEDKLPF